MSRMQTPHETRSDELFQAGPAAEFFARLGYRTFCAFESFLAALGEERHGSAADRGRLESALGAALRPVLAELETLRERVGAVERQLSRANGSAGQADAPARRGRGRTAQARGGAAAGEKVAQKSSRTATRLTKDEAIRRALAAAAELKAEDARLTMRAVADRAGLKYSQMIYAFGTRENLLQQLQEKLSA